MSIAYTTLKRELVEARYNFGKSEAELDEIIGWIHQLAFLPAGDPRREAPKAALNQVARERHMLLEALAEFREKAK